MSDRSTAHQVQITFSLHSSRTIADILQVYNWDAEATYLPTLAPARRVFYMESTLPDSFTDHFSWITSISGIMIFLIFPVLGKGYCHQPRLPLPSFSILTTSLP